MKEQLGEDHYGEERAATEQEHAEAVVRDGLRQLRWRAADLARHRKGAPQKVRWRNACERRRR